MGPAERQSGAPLTGGLGTIGSDAPRYSFFRLVYLLERLHGGSAPIGKLGPPPDERIRLRPDTDLSFATSDVSAVDDVVYPDGVTRTRVTSTFMGLYGTTSPLPPSFAEDLARSVYQGGPQPARELYDVIHHRLLSLFYRSWAKYRIEVGYRSQGADPFTRRMFCAVGLDAFGDRTHPGEARRLPDTPPLERFLYLRYAPLLASKSRTARGLQVVLGDLFGKMGVRIEQFVGHWTRLEKAQCNRLGVMNHQLGESLTLGRYVYDGTGRFKLVLGPLDYDEYLSFLPGGERRPLLRAVVATFTGGQHDVMLELHVKTEAAPRFQLGSPRASTLMRTAWLGGENARDEELVITVPLADSPLDPTAEEDDDPRGEPPQ